jgi:tetratricopeptide (TPR) repeat protein
MEAFGRASRLLANPAPAFVNMANLMLELGQRDAALSALDRALAADPRFAIAWYTKSNTKTFAAGDPDIATMERLLRPPHSKPQPAEDRMLLHYAIGKACMDIKDAPRAFAHLNQGSRLKRATLTYDAEAAECGMVAVAKAFPATRFQDSDPIGEPSQVPIFIIGMPRSGTTLVEQILASHPQVHGGGELRHLEQALAEAGARSAAEAATLPAEQIAALGRRYLALAPLRRPGALRATDKLPGNFLHAGLIHLALPNARIVHCRRHPVDTCLSCYATLFTTGHEYSYDLAELGAHYRGYAALMAHWRSVLPAECLIEVDYETIVDDLETEARRLIAFCGLDWDDACLRFHATARTVRTASLHQVRQPLYRSSIGRWTSFRDELAPLLTALGDAAA